MVFLVIQIAFLNYECEQFVKLDFEDSVLFLNARVGSTGFDKVDCTRGALKRIYFSWQQHDYSVCNSHVSHPTNHETDPCASGGVRAGKSSMTPLNGFRQTGM